MKLIYAGIGTCLVVIVTLVIWFVLGSDSGPGTGRVTQEVKLAQGRGTLLVNQVSKTVTDDGQTYILGVEVTLTSGSDVGVDTRPDSFRLVDSTGVAVTPLDPKQYGLQGKVQSIPVRLDLPSGTTAHGYVFYAVKSRPNNVKLQYTVNETVMATVMID